MRVLIVTNMYPTPEKPAFGTFVKEQVDSIKEAGVDVDIFAFEGKNGIKSYLKAISGLHKTLRKKHYDLIHAHYGLSGFVARMQTRCPVVITFHGNDLVPSVDARNHSSLLTLTTTVISNLAALFATQCIVVADMLKPRLWVKSAITIPMGVDLSLFKPMPLDEAREQIGITDDKLRVAFVASPGVFVKRLDIAQEAIQILQKTGMNVELLHVHSLPHHLVPVYMNACNALVLTSIQEASPCVIKEAMACNLPVVATNVGDVAERIDDVKGCYLSDSNPQDVAVKLRNALKYGHRTQGREKIEGLSLENVAKKIINVYTDILANRKKH